MALSMVGVSFIAGVALPAWAQYPASRAAAAKSAKPSKPLAPTDGAAPAAASTANQVRVLVLPPGETTLSSPVPGRIIAINAHIGERFKSGAVLVSLDCGDASARLGIARAEQSAATEQYEAKLRMQGLEQASDVEVALAASAVAKAKSQVELQQFQISQCSIRAPWAGSTAKVHARSFMAVTAGLPVLDIVRSGVMLLKLNVPSRWIGAAKEGTRFDVTIDETGQTYVAQVKRVNSRVDPVSQTIELEAFMLKEYEGLLPGMSGVARFTGVR